MLSCTPEFVHTGFHDWSLKVADGAYIAASGTDLILVLEEHYHSLVQSLVEKYQWVNSLPIQVEKANLIPLIRDIIEFEISAFGISTTVAGLATFALRYKTEFTKLVRADYQTPTSVSVPPGGSAIISPEDN